MSTGTHWDLMTLVLDSVMYRIVCHVMSWIVAGPLRMGGMTCTVCEWSTLCLDLVILQRQIQRNVLCLLLNLSCCSQQCRNIILPLFHHHYGVMPFLSIPRKGTDKREREKSTRGVQSGKKKKMDIGSRGWESNIDQGGNAGIRKG